MAETATEAANFLAAHAVAAAESYLYDRSDAALLARKADQILIEACTGHDEQAPEILMQVRLLAIAMGRCARSDGARNMRWAEIVAALVRLVRQESLDLRSAT